MTPPLPPGAPAGAPTPAAISLFSYARAQWPRFLAGAFCLLLTSGIALSIPWLLKRAIDSLRLGAAEALSQTATLALMIVALAAVQAAIRTASRILIFNAGRDIEFQLRGQLFTHLLSLPPPFFRKHTTGTLMSTLTSDLSAVRMLFGAGALNIINTSIIYLAGIWLLTRLNDRLTLIALIPLPMVVIIARLAGKRIYGLSHRLQERQAELSSHLQEDLTGVPTMRAYGMEAQRERLFAARSQDVLDDAMALARGRGALSPLFAVAGGIGTLVVVWLGGKDVIAGRMTIGELVAFNATLAYLAWPTLALGWVLSLWQRGIAGWDRVRGLLAEPLLLIGPPASVAGEPPIPAFEIEARGLSVSIDARTVLRDVSFTASRGQVIALVGPTGSGKTTLADALLRLTEVPPGQLFVGGVDVTTAEVPALRARFAYAPQEPFLFSATIAANIAFGLRPSERDLSQLRNAVEHAASAAGLTRDLAEFPEGIDTLVGERGITLSGGQRQRVALARALCTGADIVILDDSLSSVDAETEQRILAGLLPALRGKTGILISHRIAAVRTADRILVLDQGQVVQSGSHEDLSTRDGLYARLYREQLEVR